MERLKLYVISLYMHVISASLNCLKNAFNPIKPFVYLICKKKKSLKFFLFSKMLTAILFGSNIKIAVSTNLGGKMTSLQNKKIN